MSTVVTFHLPCCCCLSLQLLLFSSGCCFKYCECFASGTYCDGCNCVNCNNNAENEVSRKNAIELILDRNPNAFRPKVASNLLGVRDSKEDAAVEKHNKGCHCKKSWCLKKYCECYQAGIPCSDNCKCVGCKNTESNSHFHGDCCNSLYLQQAAANAAITRAVGSSGYCSAATFKKRKSDVSLHTAPQDPSIHKYDQYVKASRHKTSPDFLSFSSLPSPCVNSSIYRSSKSTFRSVLADALHPHNVKDFCSVVMVVSGQAAQTFAEKKSTTEKQEERDRKESSIASSSQEREDSQKNADVQETVVNDQCSQIQVDKKSVVDLGSDGGDMQKERPMSPGTLALMCDEQDTMFVESASPDGVLEGGENRPINLSYGQNMAEVYVEQERLVLTAFRDYIRQIITYGEIKG